MEDFADIEKRDDLRVLMLGGRRCGKTSALASMFAAITSGNTNKYLTLADATTLGTKGLEVQDSLSGKTAELKDLLSKTDAATFLVDQKPTEYWWDYRLKIKIPGTDREMFINFRDMPGEFCRQGNKHESEVKKYVEKCDVFVVVVDTPFLMESANPNNNLCSDGINEIVNRIPDIQQYLTEIKDNHGQDGKMVIFCPIKCEKWYNEGRIDEVNSRIQQVYDTCITNLRAYKLMDISIIPILTAGNIEFVEQKEAYLLSRGGRVGKPVRCCRMSSKYLRLENGASYMTKEVDIIKEDPEALKDMGTLIRPYSWFKVRFNSDSSLNGFKPVNCEQIPLHIIRFLLNKIDYGTAHPSSFWEKIKLWIQKVLGTIRLGEMKEIIVALQKDGILNDSQDSGIVHIKTAY